MTAQLPAYSRRKSLLLILVVGVAGFGLGSLNLISRGAANSTSDILGKRNLDAGAPPPFDPFITRRELRAVKSALSAYAEMIARGYVDDFAERVQGLPVVVRKSDGLYVLSVSRAGIDVDVASFIPRPESGEIELLLLPADGNEEDKKKIFNKHKMIIK